MTEQRGRAFLYGGEDGPSRSIWVKFIDRGGGRMRMEPAYEEDRQFFLDHVAAGRSVSLTNEAPAEDKAAFVEGLHEEFERQGGLLGHLGDAQAHRRRGAGRTGGPPL